MQPLAKPQVTENPAPPDAGSPATAAIKRVATPAACPAQRPVVRTKFERFELKYWIPEAAAQRVIAFAAPYIKVDAFVADAAGHTQRNTSLYLETPDLEFMRAHVESSPNRYKLRVRAYGDPPGGKAYFEIKRKVKGITAKRRVGVPMDTMASLLDGTYRTLPSFARPEDAESLEAFLYLMCVHQATPRVLVTFLREAYASAEPVEDIRITVDREIRCQPAREPSFAWDPKAWQSIDGAWQHGEPGERVLLELKFRGLAPAWIEEIVQRLAMFRVSNSKYLGGLRRQLEDPYADFALTSLYG